MSAKKRSWIEKTIPYVLSVGMLTFVAACGSDDDDNGSSNIPGLEEADRVTYRAVMNPVNGSGAAGTATVTRDADQFEVEISMGGAPSTIHAQHIHTGTACPTPDNAGEDQLIDAVEAEAVTGKVLIPLDSDLNSRDAGGVYPVGRSYRYSESTSWPTMIADLATEVGDPNDTEFAQLPAGQPLRLAGKVIEIHGTTAQLPATVAGSHGETASRSFPIACGVLVEVPSEE